MQNINGKIDRAFQRLTKERDEAIKQRDAAVEALKAVVERSHSELSYDVPSRIILYVKQEDIDKARALLKTIKEGGTP